MALTRRGVLKGGALALAAATLAPGRARAAVRPEDRKFVFVVIFRGWDPTRVYATEFDNPNVAMEADAVRAEAGGVSYVDHPDRPSVRAFFEAHHARACVVNGLVVPSVSHTECLRLALTGSNVATAADWPAQIAFAQADRYGLPHVVIRGPQFAGTASSAVTRIGTSGWVEDVLTGDVLGQSDTPIARPSATASEIMDRYVASVASGRAAATSGGSAASAEARLTGAYASSLGRASTLQSLSGDVRWGADASLETQSDLAVDLFRLGLTRCVTLSHEDTSWDSHAENDEHQSANFEALFAGLVYLMEQLALTPGTKADSLLDETVLVVQSEMGRTPQLNGGRGKDHWPHTSALIVGPGITGDRVVGSFSDYFYGEPLDFASAEPSARGLTAYPGNFGATLLTLAGIDPAAALPDVAPILGLLE